MNFLNKHLLGSIVFAAALGVAGYAAAGVEGGNNGNSTLTLKASIKKGCFLKMDNDSDDAVIDFGELMSDTTLKQQNSKQMYLEMRCSSGFGSAASNGKNIKVSLDNGMVNPADTKDARGMYLGNSKDTKILAQIYQGNIGSGTIWADGNDAMLVDMNLAASRPGQTGASQKYPYYAAILQQTAPAGGFHTGDYTNVFRASFEYADYLAPGN